ncbi:phytanoyl-CoA dioxygenase family protein [Chitinophaga rhizophila]|uniref:Phytanoyl-CoA dioxygenase family protein n=1 Tax=Chitinophaga rhizophila TaxID=2866212 RepID=A0ABS7GFB8_9BACT|nr:phytanoyl-CoA dioxygenase family protein [Chitinophaga rhizophila]MBW8685935.1 phytanoyl-CoA dioxygenase family protein [Chitinophaga rhizophila]
MNVVTHQQLLQAQGFTVIDDIFTNAEVASLIAIIQRADSSNDTFRKTKDLFAIRQFLKEVPDVVPFVFNDMLKDTIYRLFGDGYKPVKSIYFDKPGASNWFVAYHQDLTVSVKEKADVPGFGPWTVKQQQYAVQPPLPVLESNFTVRIHLDDTDEHNGALRVIPGSHNKGIYRPETIDWSIETEVSCPVPKGGIMIMRPLLLHASSRTTNNHKRRVIHIEFSKEVLPAPLEWSELMR